MICPHLWGAHRRSDPYAMGSEAVWLLYSQTILIKKLFNGAYTNIYMGRDKNMLNLNWYSEWEALFQINNFVGISFFSEKTRECENACTQDDREKDEILSR